MQVAKLDTVKNYAVGYAASLLAGMGIAIDPSSGMLDFYADTMIEKILNFTNQTDVPGGLKNALTYLTMSAWLKYAKSAGLLIDADGNDIYDLSADAVKSISEGDTTVSYAVGSNEGNSTAEQRLNALIESLDSAAGADLIKYRRLAW